MSNFDRVLDFDASPEKPEEVKTFVENAYMMSKNQQQGRNEQYERDYQSYHGFIDMSTRNPALANIFMNRIYNIVNTKKARNVQAAMMTRPLIPFSSKNKNYEMQTWLMSLLLESYLDKGNFDNKFIFASGIKTLYGTSFIEPLPYYDQVIEKYVVPDPYGTPSIQEVQTQYLRIKYRVYSPWEVYADPLAISLDERDGCRYVIIVDIISRRRLREFVEKGGYQGFDLERLDEFAIGTETADHWGMKILSSMGLPSPQPDSDIGVLIRCNTPDRQIHLWNGMVVLRDRPNDFAHKLINLCRYRHIADPHTQNQFWGLGEAKINEKEQNLLNDLWTMLVRNHQFHNQNVVFYREGAINPDSIVMTPGNRIAVESESERSISDHVWEYPIKDLPRDHYNLLAIVENSMEKNSSIYAPQRGEQAGGTQTATESGLLAQAGDMLLSLELKETEDFLKDVGRKVLWHIDQFASPADKIDILGEERASMLMYSNPNDLPGGWNFELTGSAQAATMAIEQRNLKEVAPFLNGNPAVQPGELARLYLEKFNIDKDRIDRVVLPDQVLQQMQAQQAEQEFQRELALGEQKFRQDIQKTQIQGEMKQRAQGLSKKETANRQNTEQRKAEKVVK